MPVSASNRLETLDAMRGVAAILVIFFHFGPGVPGLAPGGYLAVDFFFVLSGFVIARTYDARRAADAPRRMGFGTFVERRAIRLYPLYLIGFLVGCAAAIIRIPMDTVIAPDPASLITPMAINAFMLPAPGPGGKAWGLNSAEWSLFFEMLATIAYAAFGHRLGRRGLMALMAAAAVGLVVCIVRKGSGDMGSDWGPSMVGGVFRVAFCFGAGVLIHRMGWATTSRTSWLAALPALALAALLEVRFSGAGRTVFDATFALAIAPAIVILGSRFEPPALLRPGARLLGELSFPVYAIHRPLVFAAGYYAHRLGVSPTVWIPPFVVGVLALGLIVSRTLDQPIRARLTSWRAVHAPAASA